MGRLPRLPLTSFERAGVDGHQGLTRDHLAYCGLATDRQQRAYDIVRATLTVARVNRRNSALVDALRPVPKFDMGGWAWVNNTAATIRQGAKPGTDAKVLKAKLSLNWTAPYKVLAVGPCSSANTPDGSLGAKLLYLDFSFFFPGVEARRRVPAPRCKPCANPYYRGDRPDNLPAELTQCVLNHFSKKSPQYHVTSTGTTFQPLFTDSK